MDISADEQNKLLDVKIGGDITVRSALATQFISWALDKINGLKMYDASVQEITALSMGTPGRLMSDEQKVDIMMKLKRLGVVL